MPPSSNDRSLGMQSRCRYLLARVVGKDDEKMIDLRITKVVKIIV